MFPTLKDSVFAIWVRALAVLFIRLLASSCQSRFTVWVLGGFKSWIYWTPAWSYPLLHLYSPYRIHTGGQAQTVITKKSWMFKISLNHTNGFVGEKKPHQPPNKTDTHKYEMSSEKYRWTFTNKRKIQLFENSQSVSSRPPSHHDTLSAFSSANPTWGAKSHGEEPSPRFHMDPGFCRTNEQLPGGLAPLQSKHSRQAGLPRVIHQAILSCWHITILGPDL